MKFQNLLMKTFSNCMACKQKDKKLTNNCMSIKATNCLARIFAVALIALVNFSGGSLVM